MLHQKVTNFLATSALCLCIFCNTVIYFGAIYFAVNSLTVPSILLVFRPFILQMQNFDSTPVCL
ncbi:hypothetical protein CW304_22025 [Bacillus sp. UFRGS-B20]|nr:hypothetical protein CW304_22025 [Bacillus sp. UFRGS-B20]